MFDQEKWIRRLQKLRPFLLSFLVLFMGTIAIVKTTKTGSKNKIQDFFAIQLSMDAWEQNPSDENWQQLKQNLDRHPEVYARLGGYIAQKFLYTNQDNPITLLTKRAVSPYRDFHKLTENVHEKNYEQALKIALDLKEKLQSDNSFSTLYAFNLVQIASLQKELGNIADEQKSWKEFQTLLENKESLKPIAAHFQKGSVQLQDYIHHREAVAEAKN